MKYMINMIYKEEAFWKKLIKRSIERAWNKEDEIWNNFYKKGKI